MDRLVESALRAFVTGGLEAIPENRRKAEAETWRRKSYALGLVDGIAETLEHVARFLDDAANKPGDPEDRCMCGHRRRQHVYHEGPCRPGFVCTAGCERFVELVDGGDFDAHGDTYRLYGGTPPHENVDTSADAARSVKKHVTKMHARVLAAIRIASPDGLTCEQIEHATGLSHQSASARVRELFQLDKVVKLGKRTGTSGRKQYVYGLAEKPS